LFARGKRGTHLFLKTPVMTALASAVIICSVAMLPWWSARAAAEQFQGSGRGSCSGQLGSQWSACHCAGLNGSCAALGPMYAMKGPFPAATAARIKATEWLPMTLVE